MPITGTQTITVNSKPAVLVKSWSPKYHNELKKGNTTVKRGPWDTTQSATLRYSHQVSKGVEGHIVSFEIEGVRGIESEPDRTRLAKIQVVLTTTADEPQEKLLMEQMVAGFCDWLPTVITDIMAEIVD